MTKITINSSELAKKIAKRLNLSASEEMQLYNELSQIPNGLTKTVLKKLLCLDSGFSALN